MSFKSLIETSLSDIQASDLSAFMRALIQAYSEAALDMSERDDKLLLSVMRYLLSIASYEDRMALVEDVRDTAGLPSDLLLYFACDAFDIAQTLLGDDVVFTEEQLSHLARYTTREHRQMLAQRSDLTAEVALLMVAKGEIEVVKALMDNPKLDVAIWYDDNQDMNARMSADMLDGYEEDEAYRVALTVLDVKLMGLAKRSRLSDIVDLISREAAIPKHVIKTMVMDRAPTNFGMLCKAMGVADEAYMELAKFRTRRIGQLERLSSQAYEEYLEIEEENAKAMLSVLQERSGFVTAG